MASRIVPVVAGLSLLCASLAAQQTNDAGIGTVKRTWDASNSPAVRDALIIGVCHLNGLYYVSGRGDGTQRLIYEYDANGALLRTFPAPGNVQVTTNGIRDMATDGVHIIGGSAAGIVVFDTSGNQVNTIQAANGPQAITQPITGAAFPLLGNLVRGVAFDPAGNGGNGSLWISNQDGGFSLDIFEIDLQGNILRQIADQGWEAYGLALDPTTGHLWVSSLVDPNNPNGGPIFELDLATGMPTGVQFHQAKYDFHGGLDGVLGGDPGSYASHFDLVAVQQHFPDLVAVHRVHLHPGVHGSGEAVLTGAINQNPLAPGSLGEFRDGDSLSWRIDPGDPRNGTAPAMVFLNFGDAALCDAVSTIPLPGLASPFPELRAMWAFSNPSSTSFLTFATAVGQTSSLTIPTGVFAGFDVIRMQAIYADLVLATAGHPLPLVATSEIFTHYFDEASATIVVEANGANSFVNVGPGAPPPANGFFRVTNVGAAPIVRVTFDTSRSTNWQQLQATLYFDIDNPNMGDNFTAGNSTDPNCRGTYRNGSDAITGLIYDNQNHPGFSCAVVPNSGFIAHAASDPSPAINNFRALTFRFSDFFPGETFEFDCDTDGGPGTDGASMAGMYVEVELINGRILCGELRVDPTNALRSVWGAR